MSEDEDHGEDRREDRGKDRREEQIIITQGPKRLAFISLGAIWCRTHTFTRRA